MSFFWIGTVITLLVSIHPVSGFYDPGLQRWLNRDPLAERGGRHLLCFVQNNPTIYFDRWGLVRSGVTSDGRPYMENPFAGSPIGTVYCRGQKPVIWNPDTNPVLKQCSDAHEMQHLEDDLEHYGANCCAGIPDGFSPGSDDEATRKFTTQSECNARKAEINCLKKLACLPDAEKSAAGDKIKERVEEMRNIFHCSDIPSETAE